MSTASNFNLGLAEKQNTFFNTTYGNSMQKPANIQQHNSDGSSNKNQKSSFALTGNTGRPIGKSQNQDTYTRKDQDVNRANADFIKSIKSNHFELGHDNNRNFVTIHKQSFQGSENAMNERAVLDQARKNDLRTSHFDIGRNGGMMESIQKSSYQKPGVGKQDFNKAKASDLRKSHFDYAHEGCPKRDWSTQHNIGYKWVQPKVMK